MEGQRGYGGEDWDGNGPGCGGDGKVRRCREGLVQALRDGGLFCGECECGELWKVESRVADLVRLRTRCWRQVRSACWGRLRGRAERRADPSLLPSSQPDGTSEYTRSHLLSPILKLIVV